MSSAKERLKHQMNKRLSADASFQKKESINRDYYENTLLPTLNNRVELNVLKQDSNFNNILFNILFNIDRTKPDSVIPENVLKKLIEVFPELLIIENPLIGFPENHPNINSDYKKILRDARINYQQNLLKPKQEIKLPDLIPKNKIDNSVKIQYALDLFKQKVDIKRLSYYFSNNAMIFLTKTIYGIKVEVYNPGWIGEELVTEHDESNQDKQVFKPVNYVKSNPFEPKTSFVDNIDKFQFDENQINNLEMITIEGIHHKNPTDVFGEKFKDYLFKDKKINELMKLVDEEKKSKNSFGKNPIKNSIKNITSDIYYLTKLN